MKTWIWILIIISFGVISWFAGRMLYKNNYIKENGSGDAGKRGRVSSGHIEMIGM